MGLQYNGVAVYQTYDPIGDPFIPYFQHAARYTLTEAMMQQQSDPHGWFTVNGSNQIQCVVAGLYDVAFAFATSTGFANTWVSWEMRAETNPVVDSKTVTWHWQSPQDQNYFGGGPGVGGSIIDYFEVGKLLRAFTIQDGSNSVTTFYCSTYIQKVI